MKTTPEEGDTIALVKTNHGDIKILLYTEETPETTKNFTELAKEGKYDGVLFHRIIKDFMIQAGDIEHKEGFGGHSYKGPGTNIPDEFVDELTHVRGALSMANTGAPNSGGSQFFVVHPEDGTHFLDGKHTIFGFVYEGMDVVDKIADVETNPKDKPLEDVVIETIEISTQ
ncbi:peptidylprolyl isomerase [Patescibacteria group bacterium]